MKSLIPLLALSTIVASSTVQRPLQDASSSEAVVSSKSRPLVNSTQLQGHIHSDNLLKRAKELYKIAELGTAEYGHPTRVIGSEGHAGTLNYLYSTLSQYSDYYDISNQTFYATLGKIFGSRLVLGSAQVTASPMSLTPPTPKKEPVYAPLVLVANEGCNPSDYPKNATGSIALIRRGICSFGAKSEAAGRAGALAAVVYNNYPGSLSGTLGDPSKYHVATVGISNEDAQPYIKDLEAGKIIPSSVWVDAIVRRTPTTNIIAQTKGGDQANCVMAGGHSDSVSEGPGINDDGTGSLSLLEIAVHLTKYSTENCVRFAWWAGEEEGLLGSDYYVSQLSSEENMKIRLFMDYDMMASPNYAYQVYDARNSRNPVGSQELRDLYIDWYTANGLNYTYIPFDGRSDYDAFIKHGIPGGGIATGAEGIKTQKEVDMFGGRAGAWYDPCYHQLCDDVQNCNLGAWEINTKLIAHSIATYAVTFDGFPKRTSVKTDAVTEDSPYHGPELFM
ncbi:Zn-dependent exopeptidase [Glarea lozoyensis ATCC 20868]|uniref:Peptide hydrolase n=1 Tax=Glarea lozoyensis (strain ATCC 20868 / MF5171) TaxID=1116229 RepID=S3DC60_GLAL2|nr:Zn-dependent exopeptidase [Glarea lozoyensis ATCC 20868]EPE29591.1 Zn-dependent exopeptidase [Glarea lozoyensis ATCC 20868]